MGRVSEGLVGLTAFAASWWYPFLVGALSCINTFTVVFSGPLVIMYVAGVLANGAQDHRRITAAFANALGTTIGAALLIALIERNGVESVIATFPSIFASKTWERSKELIITYGFGGTVVVSMMPIVLHPAVIFALTAGMPRGSLLLAIMFGRLIKYSVMAQLAVFAPHLLRFFGYKGEIKVAAAETGKAKPRSKKVR